MTGHDKQAVVYRRRAEELRAEAAHANHPDTKRALLAIADNYAQLAKMIEDRGDLPRF
jgi:hypothetical protein